MRKLLILIAVYAGAAWAAPSGSLDGDIAELDGIVIRPGTQPGPGSAADMCGGITLLGETSEMPGGIFRMPPNHPLWQTYNGELARLDAAFKANPPLSDCAICVFSRASLELEIADEEKRIPLVMAEIGDLRSELRRSKDPSDRDYLQRRIASAEGGLESLQKRLKEHLATKAQQEAQQARHQAAVKPIAAQLKALDAEAERIYAQTCGKR